jgi:hypothetical protein
MAIDSPHGVSIGHNAASHQSFIYLDRMQHEGIKKKGHKERAEVTVLIFPFLYQSRVHYSLRNAKPHTRNHRAIIMINPCP